MFAKSFLSFHIVALSGQLYRLVSGAVLEKRPYAIFDHPSYAAYDPANDDDTTPLGSTGAIVIAATAAPAQAAISVAPATPTPAADLSLSALLPTVATGPPISPALPFDPVSSSSCTALYPCKLFYGYANVYYWPEEAGPFQNNSACLSADAPITSQPQFSNIQSPSVYVIFPSIRASDGCSIIGNTFTGLTTSFAPDDLSTIGPDQSTYRYDYGDLPCPPPDKGWDSSKGPYRPQLAPPDFFKLDPAFSSCTPASSQGIDPPQTITSAKAASGPGQGCKPHCHKQRRALKHAHPVRWASKEAAELM